MLGATWRQSSMARPEKSNLVRIPLLLCSTSIARMEGRRKTNKFSSITINGLSVGDGQCSCSGRLTFVVGDLRGGSTASLSNLSSSTASQWKKINPAFELSRADGVEKKFRIVKVAGDGRCMFRAVAKGLAHNQGGHVAGVRETEAADELRLAVHDALCRSEQRRKQFEEVEYSINHLEGGRNSYCQRLTKDDFWGGELEILVLSKMLHVPIYIYRTAEEAGMGGFGFVPIAKYGEQWERQGKAGKGRRAVHLLYGNGNHYDALF